jgi:hypothetical protein
MVSLLFFGLGGGETPSDVCLLSQLQLQFGILRFFDFSLDGSQAIEGGGQTDPTSILGFFDFSIYVWTGSNALCAN